MARPTKYKEEYAKQAEKICKLGATDRDLSEFFEVSESTINLWKLQHEDFSESIKVGKEPANERVKMALYHRAVGYSHPDVDIKMFEGQIIKTDTVKYYPPDTTALIYWTKNRMPEEFRQNPEDTGSGADKLVEAVASLIDKLPN